CSTDNTSKFSASDCAYIATSTSVAVDCPRKPPHREQVGPGVSVACRFLPSGRVRKKYVKSPSPKPQLCKWWPGAGVRSQACATSRVENCRPGHQVRALRK